MSTYKLVATWSGFCAPCDTERPLLLVEEGPRGLRAWWGGVGAEQRTLSYACGVCGWTEHVPATEDEDAAYDATLLRWPDWSPAHRLVASAVALRPITGSPVMVQAPRIILLPGIASASVIPAQRRPSVTIASLPMQRVSVTDGPLVAA